MSKALHLFMATLVVLSFVVPPPVAGSCSTECTSAIGCHGSCEISEPDGCGSLCFSKGCEIECKLIGPNGCRAGGTTACARVSPPVEHSSMTLDWAIIERPDAEAKLPNRTQFRLLASSSQAFGVYAEVRVYEHVLAEYAAAQDAGLAIDLENHRRDTAWPSLHVECSWGLCGQAETTLLSRRLPRQVSEPTGVYFRAWTDENRRIVEIEALYVDGSQEASFLLLDFAKEELLVWDAERPVPLEAIGWIGTGPEGGVGYFVNTVVPIVR